MGKTRFIDLSGRRFGKLIAIRAVGQNKAKQYMWECRCDCGNTSVAIGSNLIRGNTKACGCVRLVDLANRTRIHGKVKTRIFKIWAGMRKRCLNHKCKSYHNYGGRGIKIDPKWDSFEEFYNDMIGTYSDKLSLDRINPNGDYCLSNCRWVTMQVQNNNRRNNRIIHYDSVSKTLSEWSSISGVPAGTISNRIKAGWGLSEAIYKPSLQNNSSKGISQYLVF